MFTLISRDVTFSNSFVETSWTEYTHMSSRNIKTGSSHNTAVSWCFYKLSQLIIWKKKKKSEAMGALI